MPKSAPNTPDEEVEANLAKMREINAAVSMQVRKDSPLDVTYDARGNPHSVIAKKRSTLHRIFGGFDPYASEIAWHGRKSRANGKKKK